MYLLAYKYIVCALFYIKRISLANEKASLPRGLAAYEK